MVDQTARYLDRVFPRRWRILGVNLQPFTLGHAHVLASVTDWRPFEEFSIDQGFLASALFICSRDWRKALKTLNGAGERFAVWIGLTIRWGAPNMRDQAEALSEYISYSSTGPAVSAPPRDPKAPPQRQAGSPILARLRLFAQRDLHLGDHAMDANFADTFWLWSISLEEQARARIRNEAELQFDDFVEEQNRKRNGATC